MDGAVLYATKYGSTAEYANWIGQATGLPVFDVGKEDVDPNEFDFLILATPVIYYKLLITDWVRCICHHTDGPFHLPRSDGRSSCVRTLPWICDVECSADHPNQCRVETVRQRERRRPELLQSTASEASRAGMAQARLSRT